MLNMFSGGALSRFSIFALGIMPYISASIIMQLMTVVIPTLEQLKKEGVTKLSYIPGDALYGTDTEGATDASHANDLGFLRQADIFEPVIRAALKQ